MSEKVASPTEVRVEANNILRDKAKLEVLKTMFRDRDAKLFEREYSPSLTREIWRIIRKDLNELFLPTFRNPNRSYSSSDLLLHTLQLQDNPALLAPRNNNILLKGIRRNLRRDHCQSKKPLVLLIYEIAYFIDPFTAEMQPIWRSDSYRKRQHRSLFEQSFIPLIKPTSSFPPPGPPMGDMAWQTSMITLADIRLTAKGSQEWDAVIQHAKSLLEMTRLGLPMQPNDRSEFARSLIESFPETLTVDTAPLFVASMPASLEYDWAEFAGRARAHIMHKADIVYYASYIAEDDFKLPEITTLEEIGSSDQCLQVDANDCMLHFLRSDRQPKNHQPVVRRCSLCRRLFWLCHNGDKYCSRKCQNDQHNLRRRANPEKKGQRHASQ